MVPARYIPAVGIPCRNNAATIAAVARGALRRCPRVIVVDDGSTDESAEAAAAVRGITLLRFKRNRGKGVALRAAMEAAAGMGATHLVSLDGDGQHPPAAIPTLLAESRRHPEALVIGERDLSGKTVPGLSRFGRAFSNFWTKVETGVRVPDTQSGLRVYPLDTTLGLRLFGTRFEFEIEVLVKALWAGIPVHSVPFRVSYPPPEKRVSSFRHFADNARISLMNTCLVARALLPIPHRRLVPAVADGPAQARRKKKHGRS